MSMVRIASKQIQPKRVRALKEKTWPELQWFLPEPGTVKCSAYATRAYLRAAAASIFCVGVLPASGGLAANLLMETMLQFFGWLWQGGNCNFRNGAAKYLESLGAVMKRRPATL
ncbi:MAG: hypothetical protein LBB81_10180 [Treponema sp.]|jgi:hypothetical protein|nr:hypothetical protein [Treponema sp.]